jgi:hypothetical protein
MPQDNHQTSMTQKERFDSCMAQADAAWRSFDTRRGYEWKVTLGLWVAIGATIEFLDRQSIDLMSFGCVPLGWVVLAVIALVVEALYVRLWLMPIWKANERDKSEARHFREEADSVRMGKGALQRGRRTTALYTNGRTVVTRDATEERCGRRFWCDWSMAFQAVATAILLVIAVVVIGLP